MKKYLILFLIPALVLLLLPGCGSGSGLNRYQTTYLNLFDTVTTIVGYDKDKKSFDKNAQAIYDELLTYNELYDIYNSYDGINNIKTINDNAGVAPVPVDGKIIALLELSMDMYTVTDGMMNIAMGSVLSLWHDARTYGTDNPDKAYLPDEKALQEASQHMDIQDMVIDSENSTVYLTDPAMSLDVGAVGKGYAVEAVCEAFREQGLDHYLISVGGNVDTIGAKDDGSDWQVGIENPGISSDGECLAYVGSCNLSVVTSGSYERYYTVDGVRYHHIIDPKTLYPDNTYLSVTILSNNSAQADVLSTALFNMDLSEGKALIESLDKTEAMWVFPNGEIEYSSGFKNYILSMGG